MQMIKNKKIKLFFRISIFVVLVSAGIAAAFTNWQTTKAIQQSNQIYAGIIQSVKTEYPDVPEEELIKILNQENQNSTENELGWQLLKQYGINENTAVAKVMKKQQMKLLLYSTIMVTITAILLLSIFYLYLMYRQKKIRELEKYVRNISEKKYSLDIEENSEDELNHLKNELYKITVMLKEAADNSVRQKEALAESVSDISHQLKTPLTSILIMLDNLSESENMSEKVRKRFITEISHQIEQMNWLVIILLKMSRLDAGVVEFDNKEIKIGPFIEDMLTGLEILAELKKVTIVVKGDTHVSFTGDYNWNKEALQNIVKNAIEHTKEGTSVEITIEDTSIYTKIAIRDHGNGISSQDSKHIFDRFYKAQNAGKDSFGIGLSLAKTIIEKQHGYISVDENPLHGMGTIFTVKYYKL